MVRLTNNSNECILKLKIEGYQYPDDFTNHYDVNWLMVSIQVKVSISNLNWTKTDPCLLTSEVEELIHWLDRVAYSDKSIEKTFIFYEPALSFEYEIISDTQKKLTIIFDHEFLPNNWPDNQKCFIDFSLTNQELLNVVNMFREELKKFPKRMND
jgi:hypothetical protein